MLNYRETCENNMTHFDQFLFIDFSLHEKTF